MSKRSRIDCWNYIGLVETLQSFSTRTINNIVGIINCIKLIEALDIKTYQSKKLFA